MIDIFAKTKEYLTNNNIKALPSTSRKLRLSGAVIPKTLDDNEQFDNADTLCAELEPLLPADYTVQVLEPSREYPEPAIFIGLETDINDYTFGEMERNNRR